MNKLNNKYEAKDVTFHNSKEVAFQRWYPYMEGYSPNFVIDIIRNHVPNVGLIYEPFAGTGTTMFAADLMGIDTIYSEVNPLLRHLVCTKFAILGMSKEDRLALGVRLSNISNNIIDIAKDYEPSRDLSCSYKAVFGASKYFPDDTLDMVLRLKTFILSFHGKDKLFADVLMLAVYSCLLAVSYLKRQGDVRFKTTKEIGKGIPMLSDVLPVKLKQIADDVLDTSFSLSKNHKIISTNAKNIGDALLSTKISTVITSPPYLNGTNYIRNTKLELWFLGELNSKSDLREFRDEVLTSAICDVKRDYAKVEVPWHSDKLNSTLAALFANAYDKRIPIMVKSYFVEMYTLFEGLSKHLEDNALLFIDLGDSIFGGVHVPTDYILADVVSKIGYTLKDRVVLRERKSRNGELLSQVLLQFKYKKNE